MTWRGWEHYTPSAPAKPARSKYGNTVVDVDGLRFDSKREAARYQVLVVRMRAGDIRRLRVQPRYPLCATGNATTVAEYVADFEYDERDGEQWIPVIEDVKGAKSDVYKLKKRWFEAQYGVAIRET